MRRRTFLAASAATLALPAVARAESQRVLKFIPQSDLAILDPVWTTAYVTRNHGYMVFDTLYGQTGKASGYKATPQMVAGHVIENDGKTWKLTLRDGLLFHNGERVLASDCVASIKRWGARDAFGQALLARTDELVRAGRQDHPVSPETTVRTAARRARPWRLQHVRHHAEAHRRHRSVQAVHRGCRLRSVPLQGGRTRAGIAVRL